LCCRPSPVTDVTDLQCGFWEACIVKAKTMVVLLIVSLLWSAADGAIVPSRMVLGVNTQLQQAARHDHAIHHQSHGCCPEPEPAPVPPMVLTAPAMPCARGHVCCVRPGSGNVPTLPPGNADNRTQEAIPPASCSIVHQGHQICSSAQDAVCDVRKPSALGTVLRI
jgi:hypothetical protein